MQMVTMQCRLDACGLNSISKPVSTRGMMSPQTVMAVRFQRPRVPESFSRRQSTVQNMLGGLSCGARTHPAWTT